MSLSWWWRMNYLPLMQSFWLNLANSEKTIWEKRLNFCNCINLNLNHYHSAERDAKKKKIKGQPECKHGTDNLLIEFNSLYQVNEQFRNDLLCCIFAKSYGKVEWEYKYTNMLLMPWTYVLIFLRFETAKDTTLLLVIWV